MEIQNNPSLFEFSFTGNMKQNLREAAKWSRFLAITFFAMIVLIIITAAAGTAVISEAVENMYGYQIPVIAFTVIIIFLALLMGSLAYFLFQFATLTRRGIETNDLQTLNRGLTALKVYFIYYGCLAILSLLLNVLTLFI